MNSIGKITVRHFLNSRIQPTSYILGGRDDSGKYDPNLVPRPLYLKITFQRKSTELKSILDDSLYNMNELTPGQIDLMDAEVKMINSIIDDECANGTKNVSWSVLKKRMEYYKLYVFDTFRKNYLLDDLNKAILDTKSEFMRLLLSRDPSVPLTTVYNAATKLLPPSQALFQLQERVIELHKINTIIYKIKSSGSIRIMEWEFGKTKEEFASIALKNGYKFKTVEGYINIIDIVIKDLEK